MEKSRMALLLSLLLLTNELNVGAINQQYSNNDYGAINQEYSNNDYGAVTQEYSNNNYRLGDLIASKLHEFSDRQGLPVGLGIAAVIGIGVAAIVGAVIGSWIYLAANPPAAGPAGPAGPAGTAATTGTGSAVTCTAGARTDGAVINRPGMPILPPPATLEDCIATCKTVLGVACGGVSLFASPPPASTPELCLMHEAPVTAADVVPSQGGSFQFVSCS